MCRMKLSGDAVMEWSARRAEWERRVWRYSDDSPSAISSLCWGVCMGCGNLMLVNCPDKDYHLVSICDDCLVSCINDLNKWHAINKWYWDVLGLKPAQNIVQHLEAQVDEE